MFSANENLVLRQHKRRIVERVEQMMPEEALDMGTTVMVMQVSCKAPGCVPLETAIIIVFPKSSTELIPGLPESCDPSKGGSYKTKVLKPMADVEDDDILDALPPAFEGGRRTMEKLCLYARDVMLGQITQLFGDETDERSIADRQAMVEYLRLCLTDYVDRDCQPPEVGEPFPPLPEPNGNLDDNAVNDHNSDGIEQKQETTTATETSISSTAMSSIPTTGNIVIRRVLDDTNDDDVQIKDTPTQQSQESVIEPVDPMTSQTEDSASDAKQGETAKDNSDTTATSTKPSMSLQDQLRSVIDNSNSSFLHLVSSPTYSPWVGLIIRLFLAIALPILLDDGWLLQGVAYTDIDFYVFSDAAAYLNQGMSPYDRHTYRYTPYLAWLLSKLPNIEMGRYLFCIADVICGYIILQMRQQQRQQRTSASTNPTTTTNSLMDALWWLYNPLAINICTRGSSESLMVLLPVLATYWLSQQVHLRSSNFATATHSSSDTSTAIVWTALTGLMHGWSIHSKLYPIIYTGSYMTYFAMVTITSSSIESSKQRKTTTTTFPWLDPKRFFKLVWLWIQRFFLTKPFLPMVFLISSIFSFGLTTYMAVYWFGPETLQESLLYHFGRVDHRHNYSMYWYWIYLERARDVSDSLSSTSASISTMVSLEMLGKVLLIPQAVLLVYSSLGLASQSQRLSLALFVHTYLFVTHNKVITAQYFTWYLCLLPLCRWDDQSNRNTPRHEANIRRMIGSLVLLLCSIVFWLLSAYCLEMQGMAAHRLVWIASVVYFGANVKVMGSLLSFFKVGNDGEGGGDNEKVSTNGPTSNSIAVHSTTSKNKTSEQAATFVDPKTIEPLSKTTTAVASQSSTTTSAVGTTRSKPTVSTVRTLRSKPTVTSKRGMSASNYQGKIGTSLSSQGSNNVARLFEMQHAPGIRQAGCPCCDPDNPSAIVDDLMMI